jgi:CHAD domain-containing protein
MGKVQIEQELYARKRYSSISGLLNRDPKDFTQTTFHHLRVEIKKLRAITSLLDHHRYSLPKTILNKRLRKIFQLAGQIRETEMHRKFLLNFKSGQELTTVFAELEKDLRDASLSFQKSNTDRLLEDLGKQEEEFLHCIRSMKPKHAKAYLLNISKKIRPLLKGGPLTPDQFHSLRKKLKTWIYFKRFLGETGELPSSMKKAVLAIGELHDRQVFSAWLEDWSGLLPETETRILESILKKNSIISRQKFSRLEAMKNELRSVFG